MLTLEPVELLGYLRADSLSKSTMANGFDLSVSGAPTETVNVSAPISSRLGHFHMVSGV